MARKQPAEYILAREQGRQAGYAGVSPGANPFDPYSQAIQNRGWEVGWWLGSEKKDKEGRR